MEVTSCYQLYQLFKIKTRKKAVYGFDVI